MITPRVVAAWLALVLVWAPLPYGSVTPLSLLVLRLALAAAGILLAWADGGLRAARAVGGAAGGLLGLAILGLLQWPAWPAALARLVSPRHVELASSLREGVIETARSGVSLSLMPEASLATAVTLLTIVCALAAAAFVGGSVRGRTVLFAALALSVLFQLGYGLRHWLAGSTEIWGRAVDTPGGNRLRGTLVNGDHTAVLLEIGMALFLAWLWWAARRARRTPGLERRLLLVLPPVLCWAATAFGLVLTGSRAALLAAAVGTAGQCLLMLGRSRLRWAPLALVPAAGVAALVAWAAPGIAFSRLLATSWDEIVTNPRFRIWGLALDVWRGFPATGRGSAAGRRPGPRCSLRSSPVRGGRGPTTTSWSCWRPAASSAPCSSASRW
ncbi:MAG: O-antigen ligase family protein [Thermoanaerobaculia bacterium]